MYSLPTSDRNFSDILEEKKEQKLCKLIKYLKIFQSFWLYDIAYFISSSQSLEKMLLVDLGIDGKVYFLF